MELNRIVHDSNSQDRDKIAAAIAISDRGCGKPAIGVFHGGALPMEQTEDGSPVSALLRAARGNSDERALAELYAEAAPHRGQARPRQAGLSMEPFS